MMAQPPVIMTLTLRGLRGFSAEGKNGDGVAINDDDLDGNVPDDDDADDDDDDDNEEANMTVKH